MGGFELRGCIKLLLYLIILLGDLYFILYFINKLLVEEPPKQRITLISVGFILIISLIIIVFFSVTGLFTFLWCLSAILGL